MPLDRRTFLKSSAVLGGAAGLGALPSFAHGLATGTDPRRQRAAPDRVGAPLRILILGGTGFIGPHQVRYALERGHKLSLFNRGQRNPGLFPEVERLIGDRNTPDGHKVLEGRDWDVVIDNPTTLPSWVRGAGQAIKGRTKQYIFISTISVYNDYSKRFDESGPLHPPGDVDAPPAQAGPQYGPLKVRSEIEAKNQFGDKVTIVRPGLIVGPGDLTDRFSYWPVRIEKGGEIMAPGTPDDPVQYVDARDLSEWIVRLAETQTFGTFNATGPKTPTNVAQMLYGIKAVTTSDARFTWVDASFLKENQVRGWSDMPVWFEPTGPMAAFARVNCDKAFAAGLAFRPLADTASDTLAWYHTRPAEEQAKLRAGISPDREQTVLAAWNAKKASSAKGSTP